MALGAQSTGVVWLVMRQSLGLVVIGIIVGVPAALLAARYVSTFLFGLSPTDPVTIIVSTCVLLSVAVMAGYLPARRASRIDPMLALRYE
jgi:ABC-type antimicrobial peptide transport system permease subunit